MAFNAESTRSRFAARLARSLLAALSILAAPLAALSHVGSPDVYADGNAGPYQLFVTVRPPQVIPGVAEIDVRTDSSNPNSADISEIDVVPLPLTGEASLHPPVADAMKRSSDDKQFYTGHLWIMATGSWQVRFTVKGSHGIGVLSIPVPATAFATKGMTASLGILLGVLGLFLVAGVVGMVGAAAREAQLPPGELAPLSNLKRARVAMTATVAFMIAVLVLGDMWWKADASDYARYVYKPLNMQASEDASHTLHLKLQDPGWLESRKIDDFVLDHDHLMHLYMLREPALDVAYHLHPDQVGPGEFQLSLPSVPAGDYRLYADVVHANGFPETLVASITLPETKGRALAGDDAKGDAEPLVSAAGSQPFCPASPIAGPRFALPDGYRMVWDNPKRLNARTPQVFEFSLLNPDGKVPQDMAFYMGMVGHAAFVKTDGSVFAHVHPSGTVSMAALMMAAAQNGTQQKPASMSMRGMDMPGMKMDTVSVIPNTVGFPYGFPTPGTYRIFVQMKHGSTVETAAFDACAL